MYAIRSYYVDRIRSHALICAAQSICRRLGFRLRITSYNVCYTKLLRENLYLETAASGAPTPNTPGTNGSGALYQSYVETSNVNVAEELVSMIQTQRAYELNSKVISTSDNMLARLTQL